MLMPARLTPSIGGQNRVGHRQHSTWMGVQLEQPACAASLERMMRVADHDKLGLRDTI